MTGRMWALGAVAVLAVAEAACSRSSSDATLRAELDARVSVDQAVRDTFAEQLRTTGTLTPALVASMQRVDSANLVWLKAQIRVHGFPTREQVGAEGLKNAALLVQHADADPGFQAEVLPMMETAFRSGDVAGQELAMLTDRVAKAQGKPQRYGTQASIEGGRVVFYLIEDSAGVDARRAEMKLPPLAQYKVMLDSMYAQHPGS